MVHNSTVQLKSSVKAALIHKVYKNIKNAHGRTDMSRLHLMGIANFTLLIAIDVLGASLHK